MTCSTTRARRRYRRRLEELAADLDDADARGDQAGAVRLVAERDALIGQLAAAHGLGGRRRRAGDPAERARTTVTSRLRDAVAAVEAAHPDLGRHLRDAVRTGLYCCYDPESPTTWDVRPA